MHICSKSKILTRPAAATNEEIRNPIFEILNEFERQQLKRKDLRCRQKTTVKGRKQILTTGHAILCSAFPPSPFTSLVFLSVECVPPRQDLWVDCGRGQSSEAVFHAVSWFSRRFMIRTSDSVLPARAHTSGGKPMCPSPRRACSPAFPVPKSFFCPALPQKIQLPNHQSAQLFTHRFW